MTATTNPATERLLTTEEAADILGVKTQTMANWRAAGKGPSYHKLVGAIRYKLNDLTDFIEASRV